MIKYIIYVFKCMFCLVVLNIIAINKETTDTQLNKDHKSRQCWTNKHSESIYRVQMITAYTVVGLVALLWKYI